MIAHATAIMGARPQASLGSAMVGECKCGAAIMWSDRCPDHLPKLCHGCVAELLTAEPLTIVMLPSGFGFVSNRLAGTGHT